MGLQEAIREYGILKFVYFQGRVCSCCAMYESQVASVLLAALLFTVNALWLTQVTLVGTRTAEIVIDFGVQVSL
jgi:hypothetical protein